MYLIPFLHQTTTGTQAYHQGQRCILFHFYIKPQPTAINRLYKQVVSYSISTSNHNSFPLTSFVVSVVSYSISTSNHNSRVVDALPQVVVSYSISTSNHNTLLPQPIRRYVVSYSISTSNHNRQLSDFYSAQLYLIPFLHQTTTL